jgi:hypothetical protein
MDFRLARSKEKGMKRIKIILLIISILIVNYSLFAQYAITLGSQHDDVLQSITGTRDGGLIIVGYSLRTISEPISSPLRVIKLTLTGEQEWEFNLAYPFAPIMDETIAKDLGFAILQTQDDGYIIVGTTNNYGQDSDILVLKLNSEGEMEWSRIYGGERDDFAHSVQETEEGGLILAGITWSFGSGSQDIWILKLNYLGDIEWEKAYGGKKDDYASFIHADKNNNYLVIGSTSSFGKGENDAWIFKLDPVGEIKWQKTYGTEVNEISYLASISDDDFLVIGETDAVIEGATDAWAFKLDSDGEVQWQKSYGGSENYRFHNIKKITNDEFIVSGDLQENGNSDFLIMKISDEGNIIWKKAFGIEESNEHSTSLCLMSDGFIAAAGTTNHMGNYNNDMLILKLNNMGNIDYCPYLKEANILISEIHAIPMDSEALVINTNAYRVERDFLRVPALDITLLCPQKKKGKGPIR